MAERVYANANRRNANLTWWQALRGGGAALAPITATSIAALRVPRVSGVWTTVVTRAATGRFAALSTAQRASLAAIGRVTVDAAIAGWAIKVGFDVWKVHTTANGFAVLMNLETRLRNVCTFQEARYNAWNGALDSLDNLYQWVRDKTFKATDRPLVKQWTETVKSLDQQYRPRLVQIDAEIAGVDSILTQIETNLEGLLEP